MLASARMQLSLGLTFVLLEMLGQLADKEEIDIRYYLYCSH
jgi:hypothetical protein